jgi:hypothetical protein
MKSLGAEWRESLNSEKTTNAATSQGLAKGEKEGAANRDHLPHVSEEAAELARILDKGGCGTGGEGGPELEQGTPIEDVSLPFWSSFPSSWSTDGL